VRICIDPKFLYRALQRSTYYMQTALRVYATAECLHVKVWLKSVSTNDRLLGQTHRGSAGPAEHFLRTTYLPIWPPMTYAAVKCHITVV